VVRVAEDVSDGAGVGAMEVDVHLPRALSACFLRGPGATGGRRWCGFRQPGPAQYTDPDVKTHRSWTWQHNGEATGRPDRSCCSGLRPRRRPFPAPLSAHRARWVLPHGGRPRARMPVGVVFAPPRPGTVLPGGQLAGQRTKGRLICRLSGQVRDRGYFDSASRPSADNFGAPVWSRFRGVVTNRAYWKNTKVAMKRTSSTRM